MCIFYRGKDEHILSQLIKVFVLRRRVDWLNCQVKVAFLYLGFVDGWNINRKFVCESKQNRALYYGNYKTKAQIGFEDILSQADL